MAFAMPRINFHRRRTALDKQHEDLIRFQTWSADLPTRRLSMRKTKEVLRLKFELGLGLRQIARSCSLGLGTVHDYLQRAKAAGVGWPLPDDWDEEKLESVLFGAWQPRAADPEKPAPDFAAL